MTWLGYAIPAAAGALIGYFSNLLSMRMLFRPRTELRLGGHRLPFTPGVMQRHKGELADIIADAVANELLSPAAIDAMLSGPDFLAQAERAVDDYLERLLSTEVSDIGAGVEGRAIEELLAASFAGLVGSERFEEALRELVRGAVASYGELPFDSVLRRADAEGALDKLLDWVSKEGRLRFKAAYEARKAADAQVEAATGAGAVPEGTALAAAKAAANLYPSLFGYLMSFLEDAATKKLLTEWGRNLVKIVMGRLNLFQRFFVTAAQYDRTLDDSMPEIVRDIVASIRQSGARRDSEAQFADFVGKAVERVGGKGAPLKLPGPAEGRGAELIDIACDYLATSGVRERIASGAAALVAGQGERSIGEVLESAVGLPADELARMISDALLGFLRAAPGDPAGAWEGVGAFQKALERYRENKAGLRLKDILPVPEESRREWSAFIAKALVATLGDNASPFIRSAGLRETVREKVYAIDLAGVEEYIVGVLYRPLKWVNAALGLVLGGVAALGQYLISLLG